MDIMDITESQEEEEMEMEEEEEEEEEGEEEEEDEDEEEEEEEEEEGDEDEDEEEEEEEEDEEETEEEEVQTRPRRRSQSPGLQESSDVEECASPPRRKRRTSARLGHGAMDKEQQKGRQVELEVEDEVEDEVQAHVEAKGSWPRVRRKRARREGSVSQGWLGDETDGDAKGSEKEEDSKVCTTVRNGGGGGSCGSEVLAGADTVDVTDDPLATSSASTPLFDDKSGDSSGSATIKGKEKGKRKAKGRRQSAPVNMSDSYSDDSYGSSDSDFGVPVKTRPRSTRIQTLRRAAPSAAPSPPSLPPTTLEEPLVIDIDDDDDDVSGNGSVKVTDVQTGQSSSGTPLSGAAMATMLSSDDEGVSSGVQRESSFVSTDLGDGIMDIRTTIERKGAIPGTHKVRLSWATAFLRPECIRAVPHETRLVYPNKDTTGAVRVTRSDLIRLQENVFVNDTIIDFYLRHLLSHDESFGQGLSRSAVHAFSPLVVQAISNVADASKPDAYWRKIQKWTKGLDLFSKKVVLFPINSALHWSLVVLFNPDLFEPSLRAPPKHQDNGGPGVASSTDTRSAQSLDGGGVGDGKHGGAVSIDTNVSVEDSPPVPPPREDSTESKDTKDSEDSKVLKIPKGSEVSTDSKISKDSKDSKSSKNPKDSEDAKASKDAKDAEDSKGSKLSSQEVEVMPLVLRAKAAGLTAGDAGAPLPSPPPTLSPHQELPPRGKLGLIWPPVSEVARRTEFLEAILASGGGVNTSPPLSSSSGPCGADSISDAAGTVVCETSSSGGGSSKGQASPNCLVTLNGKFPPNSQMSPNGHVSPNGHMSPNGKITLKGQIVANGQRSRTGGSKVEGGGGGDGDGEGGGVLERYGCSRAGEIIGGGRPTAPPTAAPKAALEDARTAGSCPAQPLDVESLASSLEAAGAAGAGAAAGTAAGVSTYSSSSASASASAPRSGDTPSGRNPGKGACSSLPPPSATSSSSTASGTVHGNGRRRNDNGALPLVGSSSNGSACRPDGAAEEISAAGAGGAEREAGRRGVEEKTGLEEAVEVSRCSLQGLFDGPAGRPTSALGSASEDPAVVVAGAGAGAGAGVGGDSGSGGGAGVGGSGGGGGGGGSGSGSDGGGGGGGGGSAGDSDGKKGRDCDGRDGGNAEGVISLEGAKDCSPPPPQTTEVADESGGHEGEWLHQSDTVEDSASRVSSRAAIDAGGGGVGKVTFANGAAMDVEPAHDDDDDFESFSGTRRVRQRTLRSGGRGAAAGETPLPSRVKLPVRPSNGGGGQGAGDVPHKAKGGKGGGEAGGGEGQEGGPVPCMLLLDSTKGHRSQEVFKMVRKYVEAAWNNTRGDSHGRAYVDAKALPGCSPPVPLQENDCDCGVYVIHYAKLLLENPPLLTKQLMLKGCRGAMFNKKWFDKSAISDTRVSIRSTVESLRWDHVQQERATSAAAAAAAAAPAAGSDRK